jgi:hypothetical protein
MTQGSKYAIPVFRGGVSAAAAEPKPKAQTIKRPSTFEEDLAKVERLKALSRSKKTQGKPLYQYQHNTPTEQAAPKKKQPYKRSKVGALLGDDTY